VLTDDHITAARVRAALAYQGIVVETEGAEATGIGLSTLRRITARKNPRGVKNDELGKIAAACPSVPAWFFADGWEGVAVPDEVGLAEKVERLEGQVEALYKLLGDRIIATLPPAAERPGGRATPGDDPRPGRKN
jgi:hypothetical protein